MYIYIYIYIYNYIYTYISAGWRRGRTVAQRPGGSARAPQNQTLDAGNPPGRALKVVHFWRDKWTALSGPLSNPETLLTRRRT